MKGVERTNAVIVHPNCYNLRLRVRVKSRILDWIITRKLNGVPSTTYLPFILY